MLTYTLEANGAGRGLVGTDTFSGALARASGSNVGSSYAITQGTLANSNYTINFTGGNFAISARPIMVNLAAKTKVYGDTDPALTYTLTSGSLVGSDALTLSRAAGENVGDYLISAVNSNYAVTANAAKLDITPRPITLTIDSKNKRSGDPDPAWTYRIVSGSLVGSDALNLSRISGEAPGIYVISAANPNYAFTGTGQLIVSSAVEGATLANGLLTVAPVQPASQTTNAPPLASAAPALGQGGAELSGPLSLSQPSGGLMLIAVPPEQGQPPANAANAPQGGSPASAKTQAAGWLQTAQSLGYMGVLVVEGGIRMPNGAR